MIDLTKKKVSIRQLREDEEYHFQEMNANRLLLRLFDGRWFSEKQRKRAKAEKALRAKWRRDIARG